MPAPVLHPGEEFWVICLFDQQGYYSSCTHHTEKDVKILAEIRTLKLKALILCSTPFRGTWSSSGIPDVTLPPEWKASIGHLDKGTGDD